MTTISGNQLPAGYRLKNPKTILSRRVQCHAAYFMRVWLPESVAATGYTSMRAAHRGERPNLGERKMREQETQTALLVDPKEAARLLAVSPRKLWAMTFEEKPGLSFIRCGRLVRYPVADLQRWIDTHREGGDL